jgi:DNA-binding GntR family transcriptional regulator
MQARSIAEPKRKNGSTSKQRVTATGLLKEQAYDELKRRILDDDYPSGSFLAERRLAEELGMSKTPVKAALERLELEGFITVSPQQGIVVRQFTVHEILDLYEIRIALETYTMRTIAGKLTKEQIARLRANLHALEQIRGDGNVPSAVALDAEFHILFTKLLGNHEIVRAMEHLRQKMHRVITKVFQLNPARIDSTYREHLDIADHVIAGNGSRASELVENHLDKGKRLILERGQR